VVKVKSLKEPFINHINGIVENNESFDAFLEKKLKNKERINTVKKLAIYIVFFDSLIFSQNFENSMQVFFFSRRSMYDYIAAYYHPDMGNYGFETYNIYIPSTKRIQRRPIISFDKNGKIPYEEYKDIPIATKEEVLISVAAHEVRHRLQYNNLVEPIKRNSVSRNKKVNGFIQYNAIELEWMRKFFCQNNYPEEFIKNRMSNEEFDASLIELIILSQIRDNASVEKVIKTLKMEI